MKTDDLVALLAKDVRPVSSGAVPMRLALFGAAGMVAAFVILLAWLGIRPDLSNAVTGTTFWMKAGYTIGLAVAGFVLVERLARPGASGRLGGVLLALVVIAIATLGVIQLSSTPPEGMDAALLGSSWNKCPWRILALSVPGLLALLTALRRFAPPNPWLAGAAAGLLAGGLGATIYGLYCQESAAPFVAIWYSVGIGLSGLLGSLIGSRVLRW